MNKPESGDGGGKRQGGAPGGGSEPRPDQHTLQSGEENEGGECVERDVNGPEGGGSSAPEGMIEGKDQGQEGAPAGGFPGIRFPGKKEGEAG